MPQARREQPPLDTQTIEGVGCYHSTNKKSMQPFLPVTLWGGILCDTTLIGQKSSSKNKNIMYVQMGFERSREDACGAIEVHAPISSEAPQLGELIDIYLPITDLDGKKICYILPAIYYLMKNSQSIGTRRQSHKNIWPISGDFWSIVTTLG